MKKLLSVLLALCLCLTLTVSAFASEIPTSDSVLEEIDNTVTYLTNGVSGYTVDNAINFYYLVSASDVADDFYEGFLQDVKDNLTANDGKIVSAYGENMAIYAAVINILDLYGEDVFDFEGVDLVALMEATDSSTISNPYYYDIVLETASLFCNDEFTVALCDEFIANYYTMGQGMNYYGYACDNTAMFISAIASTGISDYEEVLEDAISVLATYKTDGGYFYFAEYGTDANADSTALALKALSAYALFVGYDNVDMDAIADVYAELLAFKGTTPGSYMAYGSEDAYATGDALKGLDAYYDLLWLKEFDENLDVDDDDDNGDDVNGNENNNNGNNTNNNDINKNENSNQKVDDKNDVVIPNTDANTSAWSIGVMALSCGAAILALKKKED